MEHQLADPAVPSSPSPSPRLRVVDAASLTRRILLAITGLVILGLGLGASLLMIAAGGQDEVAAAASQRAVEVALAATQRRLFGTATDYAKWDEAMDNIHFARNAEWMDANLHQDFMDAIELDEVVIFAPGDRVSFAFARDGAPIDDATTASERDLRRLIDAARQARDGPPSAAGFLFIGDTLHLAAVSRIRHTDDGRSPAPDASSLLFIARHFDANGLQRFHEDHALDPLRFEADQTAAGPAQHFAIAAFGGERPLGDLVWSPERPGKDLLRRVAPTVGAAACLMLILLATIARSARRAGTALDAGAAALAEARDTLEQKVADRTAALHEAEARLRDIFEHSAEGIFQLTDDGRYLDANPAMALIFGYRAVEGFLAGAADHTRVDPDKRAEFLRLMQAFGQVRDFVSTGRRRDGSPIWISQNARAVRSADGSLFYEGMLTDISHRKRVEEQLVHDALHDALTGLPNRKLFEERLTQALRRAETDGHHRAVLLIDCDRFKLINDSLGHTAGDELLVALSQRLSLCLRRTDTLARLGGDEFAVLTDDVAASCMCLADRLQEACRRPFLLQGRDMVVTLSIGAAVGGGDPADPAELVRNADIAVYQAKARGRGTTVLYTVDMHESVVNRLRIENELRAAIADDQIRVVYQPIIAFDGGEIVGFEALVRWQHPERGLITPAEFIPIAEESNLIQEVGEVVLRTATSDLAAWLRRNPGAEPFVTVNLSPVELGDDRIVERIAAVLRESGLPPRLLKLEITESAMMRNPTEARARLDAIDALGIRLCIDDFGIGYSSLSQLYNYPFETLKIDRSFVAKLMSGDDGMAVVRSILMLAESLRLTVVAEGVEEPAQREWLRTEGCTFGQGYLFARPIPAEEAEALLKPRAAA